MNGKRKTADHQPKRMGKVTDATDGIRKERRKKNTFRETTEAVLIALLAALLLRAFVVQAFRIPTGSMKDTLHIGDFLLVNKFIYGVRTPDRLPLVDAEIPFMRLPSFKAPTRGDVVVFKFPENTELDYIKRCIAVGGDTVDVIGNRVFLNGGPEGEYVDLGQRFDPEEGRYVRMTRVKTAAGHQYTLRHYSEFDHSGENKRYIVPENHYFMMGDNRDNSSDSRVWGYLPAENVVGEALIIYFSWDKFGDRNIFDRIRWSRIANFIR